MEPQIPLQVRPHPKNVQNESKIVELEEQIKRFVLTYCDATSKDANFGTDYGQKKKHSNHYYNLRRSNRYQNRRSMISNN